MNILNPQLRCMYCSALSRWRRKSVSGNLDPICARCRKDTYINDDTCASCCEVPSGDVEVINGLLVCGPCYRGEKCAPTKKIETLSIVERTTMVFLKSRGIKAEPIVVRRQQQRQKQDADQRRLLALQAAEAKKKEKEELRAQKEAQKTKRLAEKQARDAAKQLLTQRRLDSSATRLVRKTANDIRRTEKADKAEQQGLARPNGTAVIGLRRMPSAVLRQPRMLINLRVSVLKEPRTRKLVRLSPEQKLNPFSKKGIKRLDDWRCSRCQDGYSKNQHPAKRDENGPVCTRCFIREKGYVMAKTKDHCAHCEKFADVQMRNEQGACCQQCYRKRFAPKHQCSFCPEIAFIVKNFDDGRKQCARCNDRQRKRNKRQAPAAVVHVAE